MGLAALVTACGPTAPTKAPDQVAAAASATAPKPALSVNEMMVMIVDRPGELLWDVEKPGHGPKTDEAWYQLENHAVEVQSAATLIQLGGTGPADADWAAKPGWKTSAEALGVAAQHSRAAAKAKDLVALVKANGEIVDACEACHKEFKPEIPTGGLFMHHAPAKAAKA